MRDRVFTVISQVMKVPLEEINEDSSPETIDAWDSLKHMNVILALEEEFGVHFTDEQIMRMLDVKAILAGIGGLAPSAVEK